MENNNKESNKWLEMYNNFAIISENDGYREVAKLLRKIAKIEKDHENKYNNLFQNNKNIWLCHNCGHIHVGEYPLDICPICDYEKDYFKINSY